jgi:hypothetical protein
VSGVHAACVGCYEVVPITPGQLFGLVLVGAFVIAFFAIVLVVLSRLNR